MASPGDPFNTAGILNIPDFNHDHDTKWQGFCFEKDLQNAVFRLPDIEEKSLQSLKPGAFNLDVEDVPISSLEASSASSYTTAEDDSARDAGHLEADAVQESSDDVWTFPDVQNVSQSKLTSWDHFSNEQHIEPGTAYLSEADAPTCDAIFVSLDEKPLAPIVLSDIFLRSLYELGLGRSSLLFRWNEKNQQFTRTIETFTVRGCTSGIVQHVIASAASAGALMKKFVHPQVYFFQEGHRFSPSQLGFFSASRSCLTAIQKYMDDQRHEITTVLELQQIQSAVLPLLTTLKRIADLVRESADDVALLAILLQHATGIAFQYPRFETMLNYIISSVSRPILQGLRPEIGLDHRHGSGIEEALTPQEDHWAGTMPVEVLQLVKETTRTLRLLRDTAPETLTVLSATSADLHFCLEFSWDSVARLQTASETYERNAKVLLLSRQHATRHHQPAPQRPDSSSSVPSHPEANEAFQLLDIREELHTEGEPDPAYELTLECLRSLVQPTYSFAVPYNEVLQLSLSPLLGAQHRLLSYAVFSVLFTQHELLSHLSLQHQIQLLDDGMFAARLSTALFDTEQSSGEGRRSTGATTGLRLQTRDTWPPASSELRLVLMGVLSESMTTAGLKKLEDTISFAIRDLSDDELEKCRDVDSIHALDFLKIQYRPHNPLLEAVMSGECLEKYDRIFKHLLRVLRLKSVAQGLLREINYRQVRETRELRQDRIFRVEIQHFISSVANYVQQVAVNRPWDAFETTVRNVDYKLRANDYDGVLRAGQDLGSLRQRHEDTLDSVLRALLLKRRQTDALLMLEAIFGLVLRYAASTRKVPTSDDMAKRYHEEFTVHVKKFVGTLQGMTEGADSKSVEPGLELVDELLLQVDYNGFWSR